MRDSKDKQYKKFWDNRYEKSAFAYGKEPNEFFKQCIESLPPKSILMPADGEGRNGVYAASLGWQVTSTDLSNEGKKKASQLATTSGVELNYLVGDLEQMSFSNESFDAIGLIYAHFSPEKISSLHRKLSDLLKSGGVIIFEAFSKSQCAYRKTNPKTGGPQSPDMLFSLEMLKSDFQNFEIQILEETEVSLNEGDFHQGLAKVVRFMGKKK